MTINSLRARFGGLARGGFVRSVAVLVGGTAFAQALGILILPVLTRLYTPADFGVLGVYVSILGIVSAIACLRLEVAIPLPERDEEAGQLLVLSTVVATVFTLLLTLVVLLFGNDIAALLKQPALAKYLYLVPIGTWAAGLYNAFQYWSTRKKQFARIARTRVVQSVGGSAIQAGLGWAKLGPLGLLLGSVVNNGAGVLGLGLEAWRDNRKTIATIRARDLWSTLRSYERFPKYSVLDSLANNAGNQLPVILIAALALGPEAGYLTLATRVMAAPMALIGGAVAQVYLARAPEELRAQALGSFTTRILEGLLRTGLGPLIFAGIVAPPVFAVLFGDGWRRAGVLVSWMTPWFVFQFLSSPVSMVMHVTNRQRALLAVTSSSIPLRIGAIALAYVFAKGQVSEAYAASGAVLYVLYFAVFYRAASVGLGDIVTAIRRALVPIVAWTGFGFAMRGALHLYGK